MLWVIFTSRLKCPNYLAFIIELGVLRYHISLCQTKIKKIKKMIRFDSFFFNQTLHFLHSGLLIASWMAAWALKRVCVVRVSKMTDAIKITNNTWRTLALSHLKQYLYIAAIMLPLSASGKLVPAESHSLSRQITR